MRCGCLGLGHPEGNEAGLESAYRETEEEAGYKKHQLKVYEDFELVLKINMPSNIR